MITQTGNQTTGSGIWAPSGDQFEVWTEVRMTAPAGQVKKNPNLPGNSHHLIKFLQNFYGPFNRLAETYLFLQNWNHIMPM